MGMPGGMELFAIVAVIVLLFGGKKIPELAKGLGKGIKNFKDEMKDTDEASVVSTEEVKKVEASEEVASSEAPKTTTQA
jgi:sec-independent protein translocase protein TatA